MKMIIKLDGLNCAHCAGMIEEDLAKLPNANNVVLNFVLSKITCEIENGGAEEFFESCTKIVHRYHPEVKVRRLI